jgi:hypothetical protein
VKYATLEPVQQLAKLFEAVESTCMVMRSSQMGVTFAQENLDQVESDRPAQDPLCYDQAAEREWMGRHETALRSLAEAQLRHEAHAQAFSEAIASLEAFRVSGFEAMDLLALPRDNRCSHR